MDIVLLALHGAMVAEGCDDCEGDLLIRIRELFPQVVIGVELDQLFSIEEQSRIADALRAGGVSTTFARLDSLAGHDAFLVDFASFDLTLRRWFDTHSPVGVKHAP